MANTKREKLFTEFPPVPTEKWEEVITADLKGADYERKLVWRTGEGFNVRPYYRAENLEGIRFLGSQAGEFPYVRGTRSHNRWRVHQTVEVKCPREANAEALKLLNSGVDSLGFSIAKEGFTAEELDQLLAGISIPAIEMVFCGAQTGSIAELVIAKLEKEGTASEAHVAFSIDPLVKGLSQKGDFCSPNGEKCFAKIASLIEKTREYKHIRIVTVSAGIFSNAGSTIVEELAFALSAGNDYIARLTDAGVDAELAARKLRFSFSVTSNYFLEIAKFRAARMLWANIVKGYNPSKNCACKMHIHARTADWNQTVYDPYVNMLRGTTEAMSATIAGVHSLEVTPFDAAFESPTEFSKRIARNVELLLKHESHFDQVVDPAGGSYYVENLTQPPRPGSSSSKSRRRAATPRPTRPASSRSAWRLRPPPRTRPSQRAARRCSAPTSSPTSRRWPRRRSPPKPSPVPLPKATSSRPTAAPWPSRRCACTWTARANSPRRSCSPAATWRWPAPAPSSRATSSPAPESACRTTPSSSRSRRA